jgi:hypothetical protein
LNHNDRFMTPTPSKSQHAPRVGLLFSYDWDEAAFARHALSHGGRYRFDRAGFDLFSFPSNAQLIGFDLDRFADRMAARGKRRGWQGVVSHHEQFGALAAALVAERLGLPGVKPEAVIACQHKLYTREVLDKVAPEANVRAQGLDAVYGGRVPSDVTYPSFVKPIKAAYSVLAKRVNKHEELHRHTRFSARELWVIRRLVEPFERVAQKRMPELCSAHRMMLEEPMLSSQYNLDGYMWNGKLHLLGVIDEVMYPGTQAFMRFDYPSRLPTAVQQRAVDVAERFLRAVGFDHGFFNMEFFYCGMTERLAVIEFNPRLASQLADLYQRVLGVDAYAMSLAMAQGIDPQTVPKTHPQGGAASSFVFRAFSAHDVPAQPHAWQRARLHREMPDALLLSFPKAGHGLEREFKWLGSHRYGVLHLAGRDEQHLRQRCEQACGILGWPLPYFDAHSDLHEHGTLQRAPWSSGSVSIEGLNS